MWQQNWRIFAPGYKGDAIVERKYFYTLKKVKGIMGVQMESGYELEIATQKFYGYVRADQTTYIIDPRSGTAIMSCRNELFYDEDEERGEMEKEITCIKYAAKRVIEKGLVEELNKRRMKKSYKLAIKAFKTYVKAETLMKKQNVEALKEYARRENT